MAYEKVGIGSAANDGTGDTLRAGAEKINENFEDLFAKINGVANTDITNGTALTGQSVILSTATQTLSGKTLTAPILSGITTTASGNLQLDPATQILEVRGNGSSVEGMIQLNCHANSHGQKVVAQPHGEQDSGYFLLPKSSTANKDGNTNSVAVADVLLSGDKTVGTTETVSGDGAGKDAISIDTLVTLLNTSGGTSDLTLAAGVVGQIKIISMHTAGNDATLDASDGNLGGASSIVFNAIGEIVTLLYNGTKWAIVGQYGVTIS